MLLGRLGASVFLVVSGVGGYVNNIYISHFWLIPKVIGKIAGALTFARLMDKRAMVIAKVRGNMIIEIILISSSV